MVEWVVSTANGRCREMSGTSGVDASFRLLARGRRISFSMMSAKEFVGIIRKIKDMGGPAVHDAG